ncbi:MAG: ThuA domain-containing protein [Lentisphaeria bacterium]|nr:ThuA domain-containing protein [Lentisphaeria bacterium]
MAQKALVVYGGWDGHTPKPCADLFAPWLSEQGFDVKVSDTLEIYEDDDYMRSLSLVVPIWTMGNITGPQSKGLLGAVKSGVGIAGFHGGMCDSFRNNTDYQWMTGGQWVAHPGGCIPEYTVTITDSSHEIMAGITNFKLVDTEQYYMHTDPSNHVLATTTFAGLDVVMPYVWTRMWGEGRVFYAAFGHTDKDFNVPEALTIVQRGMLWAAR